MVAVSAEKLPDLYDRWTRALLGGPIERETRAPCNNCVMCRPKSSGDSHPPTDTVRVYFKPETKCCTFVPWLPNFLVGRIFSDGDAAAQAGRRSVEERLRLAVGVSPMGLAQPATFAVLYRDSTESLAGAESFVALIISRRAEVAAYGRTVTRFARPGFASTCGARAATASGGHCRARLMRLNWTLRVGSFSIWIHSKMISKTSWQRELGRGATKNSRALR